MATIKRPVRKSVNRGAAELMRDRIRLLEPQLSRVNAAGDSRDGQ